MTIPSGFAGHIKPAHGLVAREEVLVDAGEKMGEMGAAIGGGRTLVEDEPRTPLPLPYGALKNPFPLPKFQDLFLPETRLRLKLPKRHVFLLQKNKPRLSSPHGTMPAEGKG
jgi:hypothetical protein